MVITSTDTYTAEDHSQCERCREIEAARAQLEDRVDQLSAEIENVALVDPVTNLASRQGLERVLQIETSRARRYGSSLVAIIAGVEGFRRVNESLGHGVGDLLLSELASQLRGVLRSSDHAGRIGGDEFLILLPETRIAEGLRVAERIKTSLCCSPLEISAKTLEVKVALAVADVPLDTVSVSDLLTRTSLSRYRSLAAGKSPSRSRGMSPAEGEAEESTASASDALRNGEGLRAVSQPIYHLPDESVRGYEFLSRGPAGPLESPLDFLRVAYEENMLSLVDRHCLRACLDAVDRMGQDAQYHLNIFPATILDTPVQHLRDMFLASDSPGTFCLEISEQQILGDPSCLSESISALRASGILIAIDDVGFGRSCLESLILLEPDIVKIDRKYVTGIAADHAKARSLRRLLNVARSLGAEVIAEGIETRDDLDELRTLGVRLGQGFLWGRPA